MNGAPLLVMPCSGTKNPAAEPLPALMRYDGPMWRTLRAALRDARPVVVWFLSARYGFHPATMPIPDYEHRMTEARARELLSMPTSNRHAFAAAVAASPHVMFAGGQLYRDTMRRACPAPPSLHGIVTETDGPGIGHHRAQLRAWLQRVAS